MKNTPTQMTPRQFCKLALLFPNLEFPALAGMVKDECLPPLPLVSVKASEMADDMTPSEHTLGAHAHLHALSAWAADEAIKVGKAVAA